MLRDLSEDLKSDGPGKQPPVEFVDPVGEYDEFIGALDGLGSVSVITDHAAVVFDLAFQPLAPLAQPGQLRSQMISRRIRQSG